MRIKALTLYEPWASLVAHGHKVHETRTWYPAVPRGTLFAIHAGKQTDLVVWSNLCDRWPHTLAAVLLRPGHILAIVRYQGAYPANLADESRRLTDPMLVELNRAAGDFSRGRHAWELEVVHRLDPPVAAQGHPGIWWWELPDELASIIPTKVDA